MSANWRQKLDQVLKEFLQYLSDKKFHSLKFYYHLLKED